MWQEFEDKINFHPLNICLEMTGSMKGKTQYMDPEPGMFLSPLADQRNKTFRILVGELNTMS